MRTPSSLQETRKLILLKDIKNTQTFISRKESQNWAKSLLGKKSWTWAWTQQKITPGIQRKPHFRGSSKIYKIRKVKGKGTREIIKDKPSAIALHPVKNSIRVSEKASFPSLHIIKFNSHSTLIEIYPKTRPTFRLKTKKEPIRHNSRLRQRNPYPALNEQSNK